MAGRLQPLLEFEDALRGLGQDLAWRCVRGQGDQHATTRVNIRNLRGLFVISEGKRRGRGAGSAALLRHGGQEYGKSSG